MLEKAFKRSTHVYAEADESVAVRYGKLLKTFPWLAGRSLYEHFDAELQRAFDSRDMKQVWAASELAAMRGRLFEVLAMNSKAMRHVVEYEREASMVWFHKLVDQMEVSNAKGRKTKAKASHPWLN